MKTQYLLRNRLRILILIGIFLVAISIGTGNFISASAQGNEMEIPGDYLNDMNSPNFVYVTETPTDTATATEIPTSTATEVPTETATDIATETSVFTATATVSETPAATSTSTLTETPAGTATLTPTSSATPVASCPDANGYYDDRCPQIIYTGDWYEADNVTGAFNDTLTLSAVGGSYATFTFTGTRVEFLYTKGPERWSMMINIDGSNIEALNLNSNSIYYTSQCSWRSPVLPYGEHTLTLTNLVPYVDIDAIRPTGAASTLNPVTFEAGIYDDRVDGIVYTGEWFEYDGTGPYDETLTISGESGAQVRINFTGVGISYLYTSAPDRGSYQIYIDGTLIETLSLYHATGVWQASWSSPTLSQGQHTLLLNNSASYVDLDAFEVHAYQTPTPSPTPVVFGPGIYDDRVDGVIYSGTWYAYDGSGPYNDTLTLSGVTGSQAKIDFNGVGISFLYTSAPDRGSYQIYIDGALIETLSLYHASGVWQASWSSPTLSQGQHTLLLNNSASYVDLDAFEVHAYQTPTPSPTPVVFGPGMYDDRVDGIVYTGDWIEINYSGYYNNTFTYSPEVGAQARINFTGAGISFLYSTGARGRYQINIDGEDIAVINMISSQETLQNRWTSSALADGEHTLLLTNLWYNVDLDGFEVFE